MSIYTNHYAQKIFEIISPILGESMAKGSISVHCKKIGVAPENIKQKDLSALAQSIMKGLTLFVGSEKSMIVASRITAL